MYGMVGRGEDLVLGPVLHDRPQVHHRHGVAEIAHHAQGVGDEQVRRALLLLQLEEQVDDRRLDGDVEARGGLVAEDQVGIARERPRDGDALLLPAAELIGVAIQELAPEVHGLQQDPRVRFSAFLRRKAGEPQGPHDGLADGLARVQRGARVLEHHLDALGHLPFSLPDGQRDVLLVEERVFPRWLPPARRSRAAACSFRSRSPRRVPGWTAAVW